MVEPLIKDISKTLKPLRYNHGIPRVVNVEEDIEALGSALCRLYQSVQQIAMLSTSICPEEAACYPIMQFHRWFHLSMDYWLDIAMHRTMESIARAVDLDELSATVDSVVSHSSSALDTHQLYFSMVEAHNKLHSFFKVNNFWNQLKQPDLEGSYQFATKVLRDICKCSVYYADMLVARLNNKEALHKDFEVTKERCLTINNMDYIRQSFQPFIEELGLDKIITKLTDLSSYPEEHYTYELQLTINQAKETLQSKINNLLKTVADKMSPAVRRLIIKAAENHKDLDQLMKYLDDNLTTLSSELSQDYFHKTLLDIFNKVSYITYGVVKQGIENRRPPMYFKNLSNILSQLVYEFGEDINLESNVMLREMEQQLSLQQLDTSDLIMQVHKSQWEKQQKMAVETNGVLTITLKFVEDTLHIGVLSGRNLKAMDSNGFSDPYVRINVLPGEVFSGVPKHRTRTHKHNLFPLFDEVFTIQFTKEQRLKKEAMLHFVVEDEDLCGITCDFMGEAYYSLLEIPNNTEKSQEMQQIHLKLSQPTDFDCDILKALSNRQGDKKAQEFIKQHKFKINSFHT